MVRAAYEAVALWSLHSGRTLCARKPDPVHALRRGAPASRDTDRAVVWRRAFTYPTPTRRTVYGDRTRITRDRRTRRAGHALDPRAANSTQARRRTAVAMRQLGAGHRMRRRHVRGLAERVYHHADVRGVVAAPVLAVGGVV